MTQEQEETVSVDPLLMDPPNFIFEVWAGSTLHALVFGDFSKLSQYAIALEDTGIVSVKRYINGTWENADDWRSLAY